MNNKVNNRMRLKDRILESLSRAIKAIQEYHSRCSTDDPLLRLANDDRLLQKLCEHLDHALLHGLRHINSGYWKVANEFCSKETRLQIKHLTKVVTDLGRGRAWLYTALNDCLLESYIRCFLDNANTVRRFYVKEALVLDHERMDLLLTMAQGLEFVVFDLEFDVPYLDLASFMPKIRSLSSRSDNLDESDDHISLSSMESDASSRSRASSLADSRTLPSLASSMDTSYSLDEDLPCVQECRIEERLSCLDIHPDDSLLPIEIVHTSRTRRKKSTNEARFEDSLSVSRTERKASMNSDLNANSSRSEKEDFYESRDSDDVEIIDGEFSNGVESDVIEECDNEGSISVTSSGMSSTTGLIPGDVEATSFGLEVVNDTENNVDENGLIPSSERTPDSEQNVANEDEFRNNENGMTNENANDNNSEVTESMRLNSGTYDDFYARTPLEKSGRTLTPECRSPDTLIFEEDRESPFVDVFCENGNVLSRELPNDGAVSPENRAQSLSPQFPPSPNGSQICGEISPDSNLTLFLLLDIFTNQHEKLHKVYVTRIGYVDGELLPVYMVLSDRGLYLLRRSETKYKRLLVVLFDEVDYLSMSIQSRIVQVVCVNRRRQFWLCTGDAQLNSALVQELCRLAGQIKCPLSVLTDATTQRISMKKWVAKETRCLTTEVEILNYNLVQWEDVPAMTSQSTGRRGRLAYKTMGGESGSTWREHVFALRDAILYRYVTRDDVTVPEVCVDLSSGECRGCRRCPTSDRDHTFEILLARGTSVWLSAPSRSELENWLGALLLIVAQKPPVSAQYSGVVPCCSVLTKRHLLLCHEDVQTNFYRTLARASLEDLTSRRADPAWGGVYCVLDFESRDSNVTSARWVIYFNSRSDTESFVRSLDEAWMQLYMVAFALARAHDWMQLRSYVLLADFAAFVNDERSE